MNKGPNPERTAQLKENFLKYYDELWTVGRAAKEAKVSRRTVYEWRDKDEQFLKDYEDVQASIIEQIEAEAYRRACQGVDEPIYYLGQKVDVVKKYSDRLLTVMLGALAPDKYRERRDVTHSGKIELDVNWDGG